MELDISPTPTEVERAAILAALEQLQVGADSGRGSWWRAGVRDDLDAEEGADF